MYSLPTPDVVWKCVVIFSAQSVSVFPAVMGTWWNGNVNGVIHLEAKFIVYKCFVAFYPFQEENTIQT